MKYLIKLILAVVLFYTIIPGCSKKTDVSQTENKTKSGDVTTGDENLIESDEDLTTVDYREFYDALSSKGEWVQVDGRELGFSGEKPADLENKASFLCKVFGINDAYAQDVNVFFVWRPSTDLAVSLGTDNAPPVYVPYSNGQWVNTDQGWYFKAPTPQEEITSHYGRWSYSDNLGWVWIPGRVWAPAWVDWRVNDNYTAWTPVPPHVYIIDNTLKVPEITDDSRYVIVENKYFAEPDFYKYSYKENKNKIIIKEMTRTNGIMVINHTIINKGPEVTVIEKVTGKPIQKVEIKRVTDPSGVKYTGTSYVVYTPELKKIKVDKEKGNLSRPTKFVNWNEVTSAGKEQKLEEKEMKKDEKELKKENKENEKEIKKESKQKLGDDREMKKGKDKEKREDDGNKKNKGNEKQNDNGKEKKDHGNKK